MVAERIRRIFEELSEKEGFTLREGQVQAAMLLSDCIEGGLRAAIEAPTGLGKSLAILIPAILQAQATGKRTVIATYSNVLAEQYWRKDLPLALEICENPEAMFQVSAEFLIGRSRYACRKSISQNPKRAVYEGFLAKSELGIESEFRELVRLSSKDQYASWKAIAAPNVCSARACSFYNDCYYYRARRQAEKAQIVITNHSVVIQDSMMKINTELEQSLLGNYDFLVLDEAHDFLSAAQSGLEFELNDAKLDTILGIAHRLQTELAEFAVQNQAGENWVSLFQPLVNGINDCKQQLQSLGNERDSTLLRTYPSEILEHPNLRTKTNPHKLSEAHVVAESAATVVEAYLLNLEREISRWRNRNDANAMISNYLMHLREFVIASRSIMETPEVPWPDVTFLDGGFYSEPKLRRDLIDFKEVLPGMLWEKVPWACVSATLTLDNSFDFFIRSTGAKPDVMEALESPFAFDTQAALYLPKVGAVLNPTEARKEGNEAGYHRSVAKELVEIITACQGRTLALFSSRKEMEAVYLEVTRELEGKGDFPVLMQRSSGAAAVGEQFKRDKASSLFALRSFWTGFDAPGDTCFCVALVRVPFEVPIDPVALARMAYLQRNGYDPFFEYTLPLAKMIMRQGAGRLIRRDSDRGVIAILDPRLRTKAYGEQIIENLPRGMRTFDNIWDAVAHVGG